MNFPEVNSAPNFLQSHPAKSCHFYNCRISTKHYAAENSPGLAIAIPNARWILLKTPRLSYFIAALPTCFHHLPQCLACLHCNGTGCAFCCYCSLLCTCLDHSFISTKCYRLLLYENYFS